MYCINRKIFGTAICVHYRGPLHPVEVTAGRVCYRTAYSDGTCTCIYSQCYVYQYPNLCPQLYASTSRAVSTTRSVSFPDPHVPHMAPEGLGMRLQPGQPTQTLQYMYMYLTSVLCCWFIFCCLLLFTSWAPPPTCSGGCSSDELWRRSCSRGKTATQWIWLSRLQGRPF